MALTKKQYYHLLRLLTGSLAAQVDLLMIEKQLPFSPVFTPVLFIYFLHERHYPEAVMILLFSIPLALIYHHTWGLQFFLYLTVVLFYLAFKNSIRIKKATPRLLLFSFILYRIYWSRGISSGCTSRRFEFIQNAVRIKRCFSHGLVNPRFGMALFLLSIK